MTTYHIIEGWADDDGHHEPGDTIELGDEGLDSLKVGYLLSTGRISESVPAESVAHKRSDALLPGTPEAERQAKARDDVKAEETNTPKRSRSKK